MTARGDALVAPPSWRRFSAGPPKRKFAGWKPALQELRGGWRTARQAHLPGGCIVRLRNVRGDAFYFEESELRRSELGWGMRSARPWCAAFSRSRMAWQWRQTATPDFTFSPHAGQSLRRMGT